MARKVKEAHAAYAPNYRVSLGERGRVVIPAEVRARLEWKDGERLILVVEDDGSIRLTPLRVMVDRWAGMYAHVAPGRSLADELIAERRAEAARE